MAMSSHSGCLIGDLSTELILEIFAISVAHWQDHWRLGLNTYLRFHSPFVIVLSHVCHRWRDIVIHSPTFWTAIIIDSRRSVERADIFMHRSKELPLDIFFNFNVLRGEIRTVPRDSNNTPATSHEVSREFRSIIHSLAVHGARWRSIKASDKHDSDTLHCILEQRDFPLLEMIELESARQIDEDRKMSICAPRLSHLAIQVPFVDWAVFSPNAASFSE